MNEKGSALFFALLIIVVLAILGAAIVSRSISESRLAQRSLESTQAFWLAEAGVNRALEELKEDPDLAAGDNLFLTPLGAGQYNFDLAKSGDLGDQSYTVTARGCIPNGCNFGSTCHIVRTLIAGMYQSKLQDVTNLFDNAMYVVNNITHGSSKPYTIEGNVVYGGSIPTDFEDHVTEGTVTHETITSLPLLNYEQIKKISAEQGNYDPITGTTNFPTSFYHAPGEPNVVFVNGDFELKGNTTRYGFIVVGGDVVYDATISGTSAILGVLYTQGNAKISGTADITGGILVGGNVELNGTVGLIYNKEYMDAIKEMHLDTTVQINSWHDTQDPYNLTP